MEENMRCSICLEEGGGGDEAGGEGGGGEKGGERAMYSLPCGHSFHFECIKELRKPICPLCRTPIEASLSLNADLLNEMGKRQRQDEEETNNAGVEEAGNFERVPLNDNVMKIIAEILDGFRLNVLSTIRPENFGEAMHKHFHNDRYPCLSGYTCEQVHRFAADLHFCIFEKLKKSKEGLKENVLDWFSEYLATSLISDDLHRASHMRFPGIGCNELQLHAQSALCVNLGTCLLVYSMKK